MKNHDLVLGTAGHIDHGKSSLILALTGTDPDRLSEEKQRGITIELGFARLSLDDGTTLGVVDVPGHEKFVRQMISGSTGIDMALLCIAADDGVMPQTTEHLAVLELLRPDGSFLTLVKPQFEAPREDVGEGGVVRDQSVRDAAIARVREAFEGSGLAVQGVCESPIHGAKGNIEYLMLGVRGT